MCIDYKVKKCAVFEELEKKNNMARVRQCQDMRLERGM